MAPKAARPSRPSGWGWGQLRSVGHAAIPGIAHLETEIVPAKRARWVLNYNGNGTRFFVPEQPRRTRIIAEADQQLQEASPFAIELGGLHEGPFPFRDDGSEYSDTEFSSY